MVTFLKATCCSFGQNFKEQQDKQKSALKSKCSLAISNLLLKGENNMKKTLYLATTILALNILPATAETIMGEVISVTDDIITVKNKDGQQMSFQTNDNTTYRKKTFKKHHKKKRGIRGPTDWSYEPIAEEDDWIEVVYDPKTGQGNIYEVDTITVYDD